MEGEVFRIIFTRSGSEYTIVRVRGGFRVKKRATATEHRDARVRVGREFFGEELVLVKGESLVLKRKGRSVVLVTTEVTGIFDAKGEEV